MQTGSRPPARGRNARPRIVALAVSLLLFGLCAPAAAAVLRVPADYPTIQAAVDAAAAGDTVLLADGLYQGEGNRDVDLRGKAITVESASGPQACIVDVQGTDVERHRGFHFHSSESAGSVLRGLTIRGGFIAQGGAILCSEASPIIEGNVISGNTGDDGGGGICCVSSSPVIRGNVIQGNATGHRAAGGGIFLIDGSGPVISGNEIRENIADYAGGGIYAEQSAPFIDDNLFDGSGTIDGDDLAILAAEFGAGVCVATFRAARR